MHVDLSRQNLQKQIEVFHGLENKPSFSISEDTDVHILFFKRKDRYCGIRTAEKAEYESSSEFLVNSFMIEEIRAHVKETLTLENLKAEDCSINELKNIFTRAKRIKKHLPDIADVERAQIIVNSSDLNWVFIEDDTKYHSLFWSQSQSNLFSRCA